MEHWFQTRNYSVVAPWNVKIKGYSLDPTKHSDLENQVGSDSNLSVEKKNPCELNTKELQQNNETDVDFNVPHVLESLFWGTISVRVLSKKKKKRVVMVSKTQPTKRRILIKEVEEQFFFIIRNVKHKKFKKKEIEFIIDKYIPLADVILCASNIHPQPMTLFYRKGLEEHRSVEIISLEDPAFSKFEYQGAACYVVLNEEEEKEVLKKWGAKDKLPRLTSSDAIVRYQGLKSGSIVKNIKQYNSYRIVM